MYLMRIILLHKTVFRIFRIQKKQQVCFFRGFLIADRQGEYLV